MRPTADQLTGEMIFIALVCVVGIVLYLAVICPFNED